MVSLLDAAAVARYLAGTLSGIELLLMPVRAVSNSNIAGTVGLACHQMAAIEGSGAVFARSAMVRRLGNAFFAEFLVKIFSEFFFRLRGHIYNEVMKMLSALFSFLSANFLVFILHIQETSRFPKPLNGREERQYLEKMAQGDKGARAVLIERNLRLVSHIVKKYYSKTNDTEDLVSIGTVGLIKAVDSFDYTKGTRLSTYAARCIENEILMHFRSLKKSAGDVLLGDTVEIDRDGSPLTIEDMLADEGDLAEELETKTRWSEVRRYLDSMEDERAREIIVLRYGLRNTKPLTQREVAARLGISRSYVSRIENKVLNDIRRKIK